MGTYYPGTTFKGSWKIHGLRNVDSFSIHTGRKQKNIYFLKTHSWDWKSKSQFRSGKLSKKLAKHHYRSLWEGSLPFSIFCPTDKEVISKAGSGGCNSTKTNVSFSSPGWTLQDFWRHCMDRGTSSTNCATAFLLQALMGRGWGRTDNFIFP